MIVYNYGQSNLSKDIFNKLDVPLFIRDLIKHTLCNITSLLEFDYKMAFYNLHIESQFVKTQIFTTRPILYLNYMYNMHTCCFLHFRLGNSAVNLFSDSLFMWSSVTHHLSEIHTTPMLQEDQRSSCSTSFNSWFFERSNMVIEASIRVYASSLSEPTKSGHKCLVAYCLYELFNWLSLMLSIQVTMPLRSMYMLVHVGLSIYH